MVSTSEFAVNRALVIQRHRHLKWQGLDWLEALLMILCGLCMLGFTMCVFFDVITRTIGYPWLWLQQVTTAFFAWGVFVGMAAATRRLDHIYLAEITRRMRGSRRQAIETANRVIVLVIAGFMVVFGVQNALLDLGSFRMPSLIPLTVYSAVVPMSGALIALFMVEQITNGLKNGYAGPEDAEFDGERVE
jgi:TRAP-type C4-dicarboxylate transport system permease small subunit